MADEYMKAMTSGDAKKWEVGDDMTDSEKLDLLVRKISNIESDVTELKSNVTKLESNVTKIESNVTKIESNVTKIESNVTKLKSNVTKLESNVTKIESNVTKLESNISELNNHVSTLNNKFATLETAVTHIELNLENNLQVQIQRVAEGHLDLSRKMDYVIGISNELEMHSVRIGKLEYDMSKVKQRFA